MLFKTVFCLVTLANLLITWLRGKQNAGKFKLVALNLPP
ncbi:hypothetical protein CAMSH0001_0844 [Campylobacter showae RM3277]|uniref:Uncharacterized protein n=1 Tax=Campylobacter showae RM3277 TaxID=553219 RepID=C6RHL7_9BACT|nr:hypothetical protein CAMSH0001_0844 [Campylobacter showae RM3277]